MEQSREKVVYKPCVAAAGLESAEVGKHCDNEHVPHNKGLRHSHRARPPLLIAQLADERQKFLQIGIGGKALKAVEGVACCKSASYLRLHLLYSVGGQILRINYFKFPVGRIVVRGTQNLLFLFCIFRIGKIFGHFLEKAAL